MGEVAGRRRQPRQDLSGRRPLRPRAGGPPRLPHADVDDETGKTSDLDPPRRGDGKSRLMLQPSGERRGSVEAAAAAGTALPCGCDAREDVDVVALADVDRLEVAARWNQPDKATAVAGVRPVCGHRVGQSGLKA